MRQRVKRDFSVSGGAETLSAIFEFAAQLPIVVNLTVTNDRKPSVIADHRLMARWGEFQYGQPAVRECCKTVAPKSTIVGPATRHAIDQRRQKSWPISGGWRIGESNLT